MIQSDRPFDLHGPQAGERVEVRVGRDLPGAVEERGQRAHGAAERVVERHATAHGVNLAADDTDMDADIKPTGHPFNR